MTICNVISMKPCCTLCSQTLGGQWNMFICYYRYSPSCQGQGAPPFIHRPCTPTVLFLCYCATFWPTKQHQALQCEARPVLSILPPL